MNPCWIVKYAGMNFGPFWTEESADSFIEYQIGAGAQVEYVTPFVKFQAGTA